MPIWAFKHNKFIRFFSRVPADLYTVPEAATALKNNGIQCGIHYEHCHNKPAFADAEIQSACECEGTCVCLSNSERESKSTVSLPFHENLNKQDIDKVVHDVRKLADI